MTQTVVQVLLASTVMNVPPFICLAICISFGLVAGIRGQALPTPTERMKLEARTNDVVVVEDESATAKSKIEAEASELLKRRDYRALDDMAGRLLRSRVTFARGEWPISFFYYGFADLPKETPEATWQSRLQALRDWFEQDPDSINPRIALAQALYSYAFAARGSGWASEVTSEGWRLFEERVTEASRILRAAEELGQSCPVYYATRLSVALVDGTPRDQYDDLFDKSVRAFPTYSNFYRTKASYLLPRWNGQEGEWERFAADSADRIGGENGDILYARIAWSMHETRYFSNVLQETKAEWPRIQRGFQAICRQYPQSISAPSEYCAFSGFSPTGARQLMRALFSPLGNRVDLSVWKSTEIYFEKRQWAFSPQ